MATDVDVQYFSHLNGLVLGNNWGDLIRLLDKALVTGIDFTEITALSIDDQGDVHITLYSAHNAMLFQIVELSGFTPSSLNQKYRIKGTPSATELVLKPSAVITEKNVTTKGTGKLASLDYEIIFRDTGDVKRVYRAKNPRAEHPFIRVDESLTSPDGTSGVYTSSYAKYAMVGLLENMTHIDDYENPEVLQLPFDPTNPAKNWKITGTGENVVRGWAKWYWATGNRNGGYFYENSGTLSGNRAFTLCGDENAFYLMPSMNTFVVKPLFGCGLFKNSIQDTLGKPWFLMSCLTNQVASSTVEIGSTQGLTALTVNSSNCVFWVTRLGLEKSHTKATPVVPDFQSGYSGIYSANNISALEIPFYDAQKYLRGVIHHINYMGKRITTTNTNPLISDTSMFVTDNARQTAGNMDNSADKGCGFYFYLGDLE